MYLNTVSWHLIVHAAVRSTILSFTGRGFGSYSLYCGTRSNLVSNISQCKQFKFIFFPLPILTCCCTPIDIFNRDTTRGTWSALLLEDIMQKSICSGFSLPCIFEVQATAKYQMLSCVDT